MPPVFGRRRAGACEIRAVQMAARLGSSPVRYSLAARDAVHVGHFEAEVDGRLHGVLGGAAWRVVRKRAAVGSTAACARRLLIRLMPTMRHLGRVQQLLRTAV